MRGNVAVVTGAGSGLGRAIAMKYASEGAYVVSCDLNPDSAMETINLIRKDYPDAKVLSLNFDVTDETAVETNIAQAAEKFGRIDTIVCNAGIQHIAPVHELEFKDWKKITSVHLDASFLCTRAALRYMYKNKSGSIIYIGSVHSKLASKLKAPYVAAKHGVLGLCRSVAKEGADYGVRANVICPGFVKTKLVEDQIAPQAKKLNMTEEEVVQKVFLKDTVNGEWTTPDDIAEVAVTFATGPKAITGQSLVVSHGWFME
eukprot:CAMPEP_0117444434 /NCGR_PEP_ID=MMETSP0759-20121206/5239_1 /TAXON_ID=63605 /ORGANISM="Percolomonas cosmopolitus, Strain WS" /LENGTH=258 /DNA_ID=CAMNT_0005236501 /DNA_START=156 /DNA_END=932 /DNA_ORIENTATION=+